MFDPRQRRFGLGFGNKVTDARSPAAGGRTRDGTYHSREPQNFAFPREAFDITAMIAAVVLGSSG